MLCIIIQLMLQVLFLPIFSPWLSSYRAMFARQEWKIERAYKLVSVRLTDPDPPPPASPNKHGLNSQRPVPHGHWKDDTRLCKLEGDQGGVGGASWKTSS